MHTRDDGGGGGGLDFESRAFLNDFVKLNFVTSNIKESATRRL